MRKGYLQLALRHEPFAVYPAGMRFPGTLWQKYPLRGGKVVKRSLSCLNRMRLDKIILPSVGWPLAKYGITEDSWMAWFEHDCDEIQETPFFYPSPARSQGRFYAYAVDKSGKPLFYIKIADSDSEKASLRVEVDAVNRVSKGLFTSFKIPEVIHAGSIGDLFVAAFRLMPLESVSLPVTESTWAQRICEIKKEFAGVVVERQRADIENERWFQDFISNSAKYTFFRRTAMASFDCGVRANRTHGDFACHNFHENDGKVWIVDWEEYTDNGPALTDEICFNLCARKYYCGMADVDLIKYFYDNYFFNEEMRGLSLQAVAFMLGREITLGREFAKIINEKIENKEWE